MPALHLIVRVLSINVTRGDTPATSNLFQFVSCDAAPMEQPIVRACSGLILRLPENIAATYYDIPSGIVSTEKEAEGTEDIDKEPMGNQGDVELVCFPQERFFEDNSRWAAKMDWGSAVAYEHIEGRLCSRNLTPLSLSLFLSFSLSLSLFVLTRM